jgi:putative ABC transport system permease protein
MSSTVLKTTIRNLYREKIYAVINIAGLSLAIACCLILGLYLRSQLSYDKHNTKYKQIYRVVQEFNINGKIDTFAVTPLLLGPMLKEEYAEVKDYVKIFVINQKVLMRSDDNKAFYWDTTAFASKNIFDYFDHKFIFGDPKTIKNERFVAVSESFAKKYWGNENPIGKAITSEGNTAKITHVFADLPKNTHLRYDVLQSDDIPYFDSPEDANQRRQSLWNPRTYTFLIMSENYDINKFKDISDSFYKRHMEDLGKAYKATWRAWIQPLASIHYNSDVGYDQPTGIKHYLYGFTAVAIFILLVACINYMNLATARATKRAKEVGMRKILGSGRARLIIQFMGEAIFFSIVALVFGYILVLLALTQTPVNGLLDNSILLNDLYEPHLILWMVGFSVALGIISGIYPAFYLSSIAPLTALGGTHKAGKGSIRLREILVLIQFMISVCVVACTLLMILQMRFVSSLPLGFNKENRLVVTIRTADVIDKVPTIIKELVKNSNVLGAALCSETIGKVEGLMGAQIDNKDGVAEIMTVKAMQVGNDFIDVMGIKLKEGRDFSKRLLTDVGEAYLVNETMVKKMGWDQALGKHIQGGKVIGVVEDFHYDSLKNTLEPFVMRRFDGTQNLNAQNRNLIIMYLIVNIKGENTFKTLSFLEEKFAEFDPQHPLEFEFLDDSLNKQYLDEHRQMQLIGIFAAVCIFISCMGLFGLAAFTTEQRTKEIGIRKVIGATTMQIITMLARTILLLVVGGSVIASLIAYYAMDEYWLIDFAYRININMNLWVFVLAAFIAAAVAYVTVALQSFKTAQANPIDALRYE